MIISKQFRKAQKNHKCQFCGKDIERGSNHMMYFGMDSYGKPVQNRWHPDCSGRFLERFEEKTKQVNYGAPEGPRGGYTLLAMFVMAVASWLVIAGAIDRDWWMIGLATLWGASCLLHLARMARR